MLYTTQVMDISTQFDEILLKARDWAKSKEKGILEKGMPLSSQQLICAKRVGVAYPECIRILTVSKIPLPEDPLLRKATVQTHLITPDTVGLTLRYGVFLRSDQKLRRSLLAHEFAHVAQYERLGGILEFLQQYLKEVITVGYPQAPMEQEAIRAESLCT